MSVKLPAGSAAQMRFGSTLVEVCLAARPRLSRASFRRLVVSLLSSRRARASGTPELRRHGLYLTRQGLLYTLSLEELFATGGLEDLQLWFDLTLGGQDARRPDLSQYARAAAPRTPRPSRSGVRRPAQVGREQRFAYAFRAPGQAHFSSFEIALEHAESVLGPRLQATSQARGTRFLRLYAAVLRMTPLGEDPERITWQVLQSIDHFRAAIAGLPDAPGWRTLRPTEVGQARSDLAYLLRSSTGQK